MLKNLQRIIDKANDTIKANGLTRKTDKPLSCLSSGVLQMVSENLLTFDKDDLVLSMSEVVCLPTFLL